MRYDKLSAGMMMLVQDWSNAGAAGIEDRSRLFGVRMRESSHEPRATVFVHTNSDDSLVDLARLGVVVNAPAGRVRTADIPLTRVGELTEDPRIERVTSSKYLRPLMDVAGGLVGVPKLRTDFSLDGRNVVVGIVDTGIDGSHAAFAGRIHSVWDQTVRGGGVAEGAYGRELTGSQVSSATDENGHGTHVAGIAAGKHSRYEGVASGARIVFVKSKLLNTQIADGIRYIFRVAKDLGLPAVVNLSLGGHGDAHDGTDGLSQIIDQESGPGRIVVCAAGNEGDDDIHAMVRIGAGEETTIGFRIPSLRDGSGQEVIPIATLNGWYDGNSQIQIAVEAPNGEHTPWQGEIAGGLPSRSYDFANAVVSMVTPAANPDNGDHQILVDLVNPTNSGGPQPAGTWRLHLKGDPVSDTTIHLWAIDGDGGNAVSFRGSAVVDGYKVGSPGCATAAITVASYTCRDKWTDARGSPQTVRFASGTISSFSSEGPRRDGKPKPDIAAPGAMICSAASGQGSFDPPTMVGGGYRMEAGTSMASPFVAGIVALLLQRNRDADPAALRALLQAAGSVPSQPAGTYDAKWGFGAILAPALETALGSA
jgi:subtilisin family serine protease